MQYLPSTQNQTQGQEQERLQLYADLDKDINKVAQLIKSSTDNEYRAALTKLLQILTAWEGNYGRN